MLNSLETMVVFPLTLCEQEFTNKSLQGKFFIVEAGFVYMLFSRLAQWE